MTEPRIEEILAELRALGDPKILAVNERHGDNHAVNLTKLRAVAKRLGVDHDLSRELWATGVTEAKLLATLVCRPRLFTADELDAMLRSAGRRRRTNGSSATS
ncbi:DNA alkylation repair protein [Tessaracoccus coleopterorum]|uniref:DNA alkylation repair protein n=1 Tax=Tessaracoccus coleopterorum TaxID=2714950 RepID=UPI0022B22BF5|nr:DNA alkylation repair protein [Tessaracoccus coleopterorum]